MRTTMNHLDRFRAIMSFLPVDRLPLVEYAPYWDLTRDRWRREGLPTALANAYEIREYLGLDTYRYAWVGVPRGQWEGRITRMDDYVRARTEIYPAPALPQRIRAKFTACRELQQRDEAVVWLLLDGFFWHPRCLLGIEPHLMAFYDQPELMHAMNRDLLDFNLRLLAELREVIRLDFISIGEDIAYKSGPMISRACFDEFLAPYYHHLVAAVKEQGALAMVETDGNVHECIPWFTAAGIDGMMPMEQRAGNDLLKIRRDHPGFLMIGGYDKTVMKDGPSAMRREFDRLLPVMRQGGFIPSVDHQTPPDVSLEDYRSYVQLLREYAVSAGSM
jgi:hypothetical protein